MLEAVGDAGGTQASLSLTKAWLAYDEGRQVFRVPQCGTLAVTPRTGFSVLLRVDSEDLWGVLLTGKRKREHSSVPADSRERGKGRSGPEGVDGIRLPARSSAQSYPGSFLCPDCHVVWSF